MFEAIFGLYILGSLVTLIVSYSHISRTMVGHPEIDGEYAGAWVISFMWPITWVVFILFLVGRTIHSKLVKWTGG